MNRKIQGKVLIILGMILVVAALAIVGFNIFNEKRASSSVNNALDVLKTEISKTETSSEQINVTDTIIAEGEVEIPDYVLNEEMEMPEKIVDGIAYIGILDITDINKSLPVISQWSKRALNVAPCRYTGSVYTDDLIIAGHNYRSHFGPLSMLSVGNRVSFTDIEGNVFEYEVALIEVIHGKDVDAMQSGEWDLSLFTCTLDSQYRTTIRCEKIQ